MEDLAEFFQRVAKTGELITVCYGGGSRPGQARALIVASCDQDSFKAFEEDQLAAKQYKIGRVLWAKDASGLKITNNTATVHPSFQFNLIPKFETLGEYANHLGPELEKAGWHIHLTDTRFGVGTYLKNGKPKKNPIISVCFFDRTIGHEWDLEKNTIVEIKKELTGKERPWRIDSWRLKEGKTFKTVGSAIQFFMEEVRASNPKS